MEKICSAPTIERLEGLINRFWYSKEYVIKDNQAYHPRLDIYRGKVEFKKKRYTFYC